MARKMIKSLEVEIAKLKEMNKNLQNAKDEDDKQRSKTISELNEALDKSEHKRNKLLKLLVKANREAAEQSFIVLGYRELLEEISLTIILKDVEEEK